MYKRENRRPASNVIPETNTVQKEIINEPIIPNEEIKQAESFEEPIVIPDYDENTRAIPDFSSYESESENNGYTGGGNSTYYKDSSLFRPENSKSSLAKPLTVRKKEPEKEPAERTKEPIKEPETVPAAVTVRKDSDRTKSVSVEKGVKIVDKIFKTSFKIEDLVFYSILFLLVSGKADDEIVVIVGLFILAST